VATAANMGGLGCGPLLAGALAQYADRSLYLPFGVHLVLVACSALVLLGLAETVPRRRPLSAVRPRRPGLPPRVRAVFGPAATASFVGFALFGVFTSVSPSFLAQSLDVHNRAVSGLVVALAFFASTAGQLAVGRVGVSRRCPWAAPRSWPVSRCWRARCGGSCCRWWCSARSSAGAGRGWRSAERSRRWPRRPRGTGARP
jgi:MFS family permease